MLKLFCLVFVLVILVLDLGQVKSAGPTRHDNSLVRVKRIVLDQIADKHRDTVFAYSSNGKDCIGTFVAANMILTAAHCCEQFAVPSPITIYNEKRKVNMSISAVHINPIFVDAGRYFVDDIAVIQLDRNVDSIRVASLGYNYAISCSETVYHFDLTDPSNGAMSDQLKVFGAKVAECSWFTYYKHYIPFVHLKDALVTEAIECNVWYGRNGEPLFTQDDLLIGVESRSVEDPEKIGKYARISKNKEFLQTVLGQS